MRTHALVDQKATTEAYSVPRSSKRRIENSGKVGCRKGASRGGGGWTQADFRDAGEGRGHPCRSRDVRVAIKWMEL